MNKVLIIEQVTPIIRRIKKACRGLNLEFFDANSEYEAVNCFIENIEDIKVIIIDVSMNNFDGFRILKKIRGVSKNVKVIVLTSLNTRDYFVSCLRIGINDYILKPFDDAFIKSRVMLAIPKGVDNKDIQEIQDPLNNYFDKYYALTLMNSTKLFILIGVYYNSDENNDVVIMNNNTINNDDYKLISSIFPEKSIFSTYKTQSFIGIVPDVDDNGIEKFMENFNNTIGENKINFFYESIIIPKKGEEHQLYDQIVEKLERRILRKIKFSFSNVEEKIDFNK
ncbi:response regulator [Clostridiaceae bacterium HSG29]|nr:response regulator [Clostridiaceae bacterium HSG29]